MTCSNCGLLNPDSALWCDCGYDFAQGRVKTARRTEGTHPGWLKQPRSGTWKLAMGGIWVCVLVGFVAIGLVVALPYLFIFIGALGMGGPLPKDATGPLTYLVYAVVLLPVLLLLGGFWLIASRPQQAQRPAIRSTDPPSRNP
jgi:hypothetical protein